MKVALDATPLTLSSGGIARYTCELAKALSAGFPEDEIFLLSDQPFTVPTQPSSNLRIGMGPCRSWHRRWWLCGLPYAMLRHGVEVFHGTHFVAPWIQLRPSVITIHDLSPWLDPAWHRHADFVRNRTPVLIGLNLVTMFITPSEVIRRQAMERFQIPPSRIAAIPLAAASHFRPSQLHPGQTVQVERPYFLFVGTLEPRKNIEMLISAWREVSRLHKVDLILAGRRRHDCPTVAPQPGLHLLEEIADEALPALYSGAVAFLYPSQYEGFGLPVLEAMQCGAAAIVSKDAALREVSDGVAIELDCWDAKAWIEAMVTVLTRADVAAELRNRSLRRAKEFSWSRTARATREVYAEAIRRLG